MWPEFTVGFVGISPDHVGPLLGAVVGGLISLSSTYGIEWLNRKRATRQLAIAISSEIESAMRMLRFRKALERLTATMIAAQKGGTSLWAFKIDDDSLPISRSAMSTIGSFRGDVPYLLAELLTLSSSAKLDLDDIRDPEGSLKGQDSQTIFSRYWELVAIMDHAMDTANKLVCEIAKQYRVPTRRPWDPEPAPKTQPPVKSLG